MASSIELAFITRFKCSFLKKAEVDAVNIVNQTFFGFSKLNITGSNFSDGKLLANSSILISLSSRILV